MGTTRQGQCLVPLALSILRSQVKISTKDSSNHVFVIEIIPYFRYLIPLHVLFSFPFMLHIISSISHNYELIEKLVFEPPIYTLDPFGSFSQCLPFITPAN